MLELHSDRLRVELAEPGEAPNTGFRFDRAGFVSEVILDGSVRFCTSEPRNLRHPPTGGRGLCSEYRFDISEAVAIGDYFPKFGVGLLRKEEAGKYVFHRTYRDIVPFPVRCHQADSQAVFVTEPLPCQGYALRAVKTVALAGNCLSMTMRAENAGERDLAIEEYCHNFISIDGMAVGSDYVLELPQGPDFGSGRLTSRSGRMGSLRGHGRGVTFCEFSAIDTDVSIDSSQMANTPPFTWILSHRGARASVSCVEGFTPARAAVWAIDHMVCPEVFHAFSLKAGEAHTWTRTWTFDTQPAE